MSPGVTLFISELMAKRLELFNGAMPSTPRHRHARESEKSERGIRSEGSETLTASKSCEGYPKAEIQRDTAAVLPKSSKGAEPAPPSCTLNHRTTEPQYHRDGHLRGRWSLVFTFKVNQRCGGMCYLPA
jgi:hypothetical protein